MSLKKTFMGLVRKLGLMQGLDRLYFLWNRIRFANKNKRFLDKNPGIRLPPDYMLYEAYRLDYQSYYDDGRETAFWILNQFSGFTNFQNKSILEWGCGPARIIRHLPAMLPGNNIQGSDYNVQTIEWCRNNIHDVNFSINQLDPPLNYPGDTFDLVYSISVFTHLSLENHYRWLDEIYRVLKRSGLFLLSTQGDVFQSKLNKQEREMFLSGKLVERAKVKEGHRSFSAFHPTAFMEKMFNNKWKVLKHIPGKLEEWGPEQDTWIVQKV